MLFLLHCFINAILFINILPLCWPCTQESPPPNTSKDINLEEIQLPHFDCYTGKTLLLCNTTLFQNISTSAPAASETEMTIYQPRNKFRKLQQGPDNYRVYLKAPLKQKVFFSCTCKCAHAGI